jgi:hypothetical protein
MYLYFMMTKFNGLFIVLTTKSDINNNMEKITGSRKILTLFSPKGELQFSGTPCLPRIKMRHTQYRVMNSWYVNSRNLSCFIGKFLV